MHYLIKLIVEADSADEALEAADSYASDLVEGGDFDWYDMNGRWGDSVAVGLKSQRGQKQLKEAMDGTRREFNSAMAHIRYMVEHFTDDQIYEEDFGTREEQEAIRNDNDKIYYLSRYQLSCAGGSYTNDCYLYCEGWGRITNNKDLSNQEKYTKKKQWIVPVDFHN